MRRTLTAISSCLLVLAIGLPALAQEGEGGAAQGDEAAQGEGGNEAQPDGQEPGPGEAPAATDDALKTSPSDMAAPAPAPVVTSKAEGLQSWKDIVVVPRKPFLKGGRVELLPQFSVTLNDNLIQHFSLGGEVNYFLTDILSIGVTGMYYFKNVLDEEFYTRYHFGRVPSLNRYRFTAEGHFAYVPIYGKFAMFNNHIFHYEVFISGGIGVTQTEVIPRDFKWESFTNYALTFPVCVGGRFFLTRWMAVNFAFRNNILVDKYEPTTRGVQDAQGRWVTKDGVVKATEAEAAKENAETSILDNMMFTIGFSFFLPTEFKYTTFR